MMDLNEEQGIGLIGGQQTKRSTGDVDSHRNPARLWKYSTYGLGLFSFLQFCVILWLSFPRPSQSTYESGFSTDMDDAKSSIFLEQVRFTNAIRADENGFLYQVNNPNDPVYTGPPSKEIDDNWDALTAGRYIMLDESEVSQFDKDQYSLPLKPLPKVKGYVESPGVYGGIDVMHSLHCVNALRKMLYPDHYKDHSFPMEYMQMHLGELPHCPPASFSMTDPLGCRPLYRSTASVSHVLWRHDPSHIAAGLFKWK